MPGVHADFNSVRPDGNLRVLRARAPYVAVGEALEAYDEDGNTMQVRVAEVDTANGLVMLTPSWNTFTSVEQHAGASARA